jgi:DNA-binding NtrC family response regulator
MYSLPKSIFLVDDDCFHLELMKQILSHRGSSRITLFNSGMECLNHLGLEPEVVFLDFDMDVFSGHHTLIKIKKHYPNTLVVIISAQNNPSLVLKLKEDGAFDFIKKDNFMLEHLDAVLIRIHEFQKNNRRKSFPLNVLLNFFHF